MKAYLRTLHTKSTAHKKRFAFLTALGVTLLIFSLWTIVKFGQESDLAIETTGPVNLAATAEANVTPFKNILSGLRDSWASLINLTNGK